ncbi:MAG: hypothetical protein ACOCYG_03280, partial [Spirochaetota bacterium]
DESDRETLSDRVARGLHPPLPLASGTVIWGWRFIREAERQGLRRLLVATVEVTNRDAILLALRMENRPRRYSWREVAAIHRLCKELSVVVDEELSRLVTGDGALAAKAERFAALPPPWQEALQEGLVDLRTAESLGKYVSASSSGIEALLETTGGLTFSERRQVLRLALECARREVTAVAGNSGTTSGAGSLSATAPAVDVPGGVESRLLELVREAAAAPDPVVALKRRRYPRLTSLSDRFESIRDEVLAGTGIRLTPPPYFEGERFDIAFSFATAEELDRRLAALGKLKARAGELQDLL